MGIMITHTIMIITDIPLATFTSIMVTMIFIMEMGSIMNMRFIMIPMREGDTANRSSIIMKQPERRKR